LSGASSAWKRHAIPERLRFVDAIERTSVDKINMKELRSLLGTSAEMGTR
jgi:fatty-acyl-CoA synthase